jgi:DNA/RNA-binding domain of Phe-tRNA-synthetase-like protein
VADPIDLSGVHRELDLLKRQLCHCQLSGECLGCKGIEMVRQQVEAISAAASQPVLLQFAQETAAKDMLSQFSQMQERLMEDPQIRQAADAFQERLMEDPQARSMIEELMKRLSEEGEGGTDKLS